MQVVLYTGKGGVGKTTTAAATAVRAAALGHRTLVISADPAHSLGDVLGRELGSEPIVVAERLSALEVDARVELARHWGRIRDYLVALFRHQGIEEVVAEELALIPGAEELTTLVAVDEYARSGDFDFVVVDCAPTDATLRLVTLPEVAHGAVRILLRIQRTIAAVVTPLAAGLVPVPLPDSAVFRDAERLIYRTLKRLRARLLSPDTRFRMVVTPERMVIDEARRAFTELSLFELTCDAVVMNRLLPQEATEEAFFRDWGRIQRERVEEVQAHFAPLTVFFAPLQDDEVIGLERLAEHGAAIFGDVDPAASLPASERVRFTRGTEGYEVHLPLPGARADELDVVMVADELVVRAGSRRRALKLPGRIAACTLGAARLEAGELVVAFEAGASRAPR
jgi:arsenite-transporting ATPase